jgi:hypothetical protein
MKYIKFYLTRGEPITLPEDKALAILRSTDQLVTITNVKGEWTGETIHKSHIVQTVRDLEAEMQESRKHPRLPQKPIRRISDVDMSAMLQRSRPNI